MPPIRTDKGGLALMGLGGAAFLFVCTVPAILTLPEHPSFDRLILSCLAGGLVFGLSFALMHLALRGLKIGHRAIYGLAGALGLIAAYASQMPPDSLAAVIRKGMVAYFFILPALAGALFGFLYAWRAGWDHKGDDPAALAAAVAGQAGADGEAPAHIAVETTEYFDGPVRVRTSFALMVVAAVAGSILFGLGHMVISLGMEASYVSERSWMGIFDHLMDVSLGSGVMTLGMIVIATLPVGLSVLVGHFIARAFRTQATWAYFLIGLATPIVVAILTMGLFTGVALFIVLPTAIAMALYRSFAGLEPVPVREDIIVADDRHLVAANHPRRRYGRVIRPGR